MCSFVGPKYWLRFKDVEHTKCFRDFFEFSQSKSYSEALCESIGSIMNQATASGRNMHSENFSKEIFLRVNLPPLHKLYEGLIPDILKDDIQNGKEFLRKADSNNRQLRKLNFATTSSSI